MKIVVLGSFFLTPSVSQKSSVTPFLMVMKKMPKSGASPDDI